MSMRSFVGLIILAVLIAGGIGGYGLYLEKTKSAGNNGQTATSTVCNYNDPDKSYIKKEKNCIINFLCNRGEQAFADDCGCGCKIAPSTEPVKYECTPESRQAQFCNEIYKPVCGWFDDTIKCFKYPCAQNFSNECFACQDGKVAYWTNAACPE